MNKLVMNKTVGVIDDQRVMIKSQTKIRLLKLEEDVDALMILIEDHVHDHLQNTIAFVTTEEKAANAKITVLLTIAVSIPHLAIEEMPEVTIEDLCLKKMEIITKKVCLFQIYQDLLCLITNLQKCKTSKFPVFSLFTNATKKIMLIATLKNF